MDAIYFSTSNDLFNGKKVLSDMGIKCYESDVMPDERFLMERFIYGMIEFDGPSIKKGRITHYLNPSIHKAEYKPDFRILSLDIETGRDNSIYSIALHFTGANIENREVFIRSDRDISNEAITCVNSEREVITGFISKLNQMDPDIIIGWHVIGFDLEFIRRRAEFYGINFSIGRDGSAPVIRSNQNGVWHCAINGRIVIDGPPTLRGAFYTFENYKLETVAREVLGEGKDIEEEGKVDEIERRFREDKEALARYNLLDTTLVTDIFNKLGIIDLTFTRAITSGLTMDRVGMSVAAFDFFMLPQIHRHGRVAPDTADIVTISQGKGGFVFTKDPGFYDSIIVLDFKSLYPSIIRTFFIDPLSLLESETNPVNTPVDIKFSSTENVLPGYIKTLMDKRGEAKQNDDFNLSQSIKILMNSFYEVMGTPLSRFYAPQLPAAITGAGQWLLKTASGYLEEMGYRVIYGDTDSLFIELKPEERKEFNRSAENINSMTNNFITCLIREKFNIESCLELEYEKHFSKFFLPGLRGSHSGAKKRYAGLLSNKDGEKLSLTGLEFVRSDWTKLAREFQYNLFSMIFSNMDVSSYIRETVKNLESGKHDGDLIYRKKLTKSVSEYNKIVPPQVKAVIMLGKAGKNLRSISYIMTKDGPVPMELKPENIDYNHYIDKQLKPIADSILTYTGTTFDSIVYTRQPELF